MHIVCPWLGTQYQPVRCSGHKSRYKAQILCGACTSRHRSWSEVESFRYSILCLQGKVLTSYMSSLSKYASHIRAHVRRIVSSEKRATLFRYLSVRCYLPIRSHMTVVRIKLSDLHTSEQYDEKTRKHPHRNLGNSFHFMKSRSHFPKSMYVEGILLIKISSQYRLILYIISWPRSTENRDIRPKSTVEAFEIFAKITYNGNISRDAADQSLIKPFTLLFSNNRSRVE